MLILENDKYLFKMEKTNENNQNNEGKFLNKIGNKLADEEEAGSDVNINKELESLSGHKKEKY